MRHFIQSQLQVLLVVLAVTVFARPAQAQYLLETGSPTFATADPVPMGYVNVANGNLHIEIPIAGFSERGSLAFVAKMVYDSRIWKIVDNGTSQSWQPTNVPDYPLDGSPPIYRAGWRLLFTGGGKVTYDQIANVCYSGGNPYPWYQWQNFRFRDLDGTLRGFPLFYESSNVCHTGGTATSSGPSLDATGYRASWTTYAAMVEDVISPNGATVYKSVPGVYTIAKDPNGNYLDRSSVVYPNDTVTDTLNRVVWQKTLDQSGEIDYAVPTSQGTSTYKFFFDTLVSMNTNFGVSGVTEYNGAVYTLRRIELPNASAYTFTYENNCSYCYGLLKTMTLPSGAVVNFTHTNVTDGQGNVNRWVNTVTASGGTTTYTRDFCSPSCNKIRVTRPSGDETVSTFTLNTAGAWNTQTKSYTGTAASGTLLLTVNRDYDFSLSNPVSGGIGFVRPTRMTTILPGPAGDLVKKTESAYDSFTYSYRGTNYTGSRGNVLTQSEFAYGSGTAGELLRQQVLTYLHDSNSNYLNKNIVKRVTNAQTKDAAGTKIAEMITTYDSTSLTSVSGVTHHDTTNFGTGYTLRGNPTLVQAWTGSGSSTVCTDLNYLCSTVTYDITGQVRSTVDAKGNTVSMTYVDNYRLDNGSNPPPAYSPTPPTTNAMVTQVTTPLTGSVTMAYYYGSGKRAWATDQNSKTTYFHFLDTLDRFTKTNLPLGGWAQKTYDSPTQVRGTATLFWTDPNNPTNETTTASYDTATRTTTGTLTSDPDAPYNTTFSNSTYDTSGRLQSATNPYRSGQTVYSKSVQYDGLNRETRTTLQDGNYTQTFYGAAVGGAGGITAQLCTSGDYDLGFPGLGYPVLSKDEAGKKRQGWTDGLGRLIEVDEPDSSGALTLKTCYQYNLLGSLRKVGQGVQTRTMSYDALSRLTTESTPEGGTINLYYTTSAGALCSGNPSAACRRVDPRLDGGGNPYTTTYTYDTENRLTGKSYSNGDPSVTYSYDQTSCNGLTITNGKTRRTCMTDGSGTAAWSYDGEGHVLAEKRTIGTVTKTISYTYNGGGSLFRITYPSGKIVTHYYSSAGRLTGVQCTSVGCSTNFASSATYFASGALDTVVLGYTGTFGGITVKNTYNSRLQPVNMTAKHTNNTVVLLDYTYNFLSGSINDGHVKSVTNNLVAGRTQTYTYDEMNRLKTAQSQANSPDPNCWGLQYGYDRYANLLSASITKCTGPALSLSVDNTTNKITNTGFQYDAAGNLTNDGFSSYTWNAEGRMATTAGVTYTYDGDGRRVKKDNGKLYWYGINGQVLAESDASGNVTSEFIFFGSMRIARRDPATGNVSYFLGDRLGNARVVTNSSGGIVEESDFYPFGVERPITDTLDNNYKFTGHERDTESGLDHTLYRQYSSGQGRWLSPDRHLGSPTSPQSWNRYSYGNNSPCDTVDPDGRQACQWINGRLVCEFLYADDVSDSVRRVYNYIFGWLSSYWSDDLDEAYWDERDKRAMAAEMGAYQYLPGAFEAAKRALENPDCRSLFNISGDGIDPEALLTSIIDGSGPGYVSFSYNLGARGGVFPGNGNRENGYETVSIVMGTDGEWGALTTTDDDRARTLLHELGHVFNLLRGAGGSQFVDDVNPDGTPNGIGQLRNKELEEICVPR